MCGAPSILFFSDVHLSVRTFSNPAALSRDFLVKDTNISFTLVWVSKPVFLCLPSQEMFFVHMSVKCASIGLLDHKVPENGLHPWQFQKEAYKGSRLYIDSWTGVLVVRFLMPVSHYKAFRSSVLCYEPLSSDFKFFTYSPISPSRLYLWSK